MGEVVNLRRARKAKARVADAGRADANRARFGRLKGERAADAVENARREAVLDGARLDQAATTRE